MRRLKLQMIYLALAGFISVGTISNAAHAESSVQGRLFKVNRFLDNPDKLVDRSAETWFHPLGEIESIRTFKDANGVDSRMRASAFLISPCYIVTNHHAVYAYDLPVVEGLDYRMTFRAGWHATSPFAGDTIATPVVSGAREINSRNDWTLLRLRECIGKAPWNFGWFEVAAAPSARLIDLPIGIAGYAGDQERGVLLRGVGKVTGVSDYNGLVMFSAPTAKGQSGGPVFAKVGGNLKVIGINTRQRVTLADKGNATFSTYSAGRANEFVNLYDVVNDPRVKVLLQADRAGVENAHVTRLQLPESY